MSLKGPKIKYSLTCLAPNEVKSYNKAYNKMVTDRCVQTPKFSPHLSCANHEWEEEKGAVCPYLDVRKVGSNQ